MDWSLFIQILILEFVTALMVIAVIQTARADKDDRKDKREDS